jgi:HNH endonuclease
MSIDPALVRLVRKRARDHCEYCQLPKRFSSIAFELDHIIAEQHEGQTVSSNLALACFADNHHKGPNLGGIDPKTGKRTWLFNPRRQSWHRHFRWDGPILVGRTAVGRVTVAVLKINLPHRVAQRAALIAEGVFPPKPKH